MHIRHLFVAGVLAVLVFVQGIAPAHSSDLPNGETTSERPNIVWLISEDNSYHYLELFDTHGAPTPNIAKLAKSGLLFRNAFSNAPVCSVARTTLMTSCFAPRIGTQFHRRSKLAAMPPGVKMFPAYLRDAGYYTTNRQKKDYNAIETPGTWDQSSPKATWRDRAQGQPFFHMQSFGSTHEGTLHFPKSHDENRPTKTDPQDVFVPPYHPDTPLMRYTVARYHDNIQTMDAQIGAVVDDLRSDGLLDDTFIFYFGDHGGVLPRGKGYAYESGLHVPLVVHVPKNFGELSPFLTGSSIDGFVSFVDFGATALKLAGLPSVAGVDGQAFLGAGIDNSEVKSRDTAFGYADRFDEKYDFVRTLRKGKFEYVRSYQPFNFDGLQNNYRYQMAAYEQWRDLYQDGKLNAAQSQFFETRPAEMLFNIEADPHEVNNLADDPEHRAVLGEMRTLLCQQEWAQPDLSFIPESILFEDAFENPVQYGQENVNRIQILVSIADLQLESYADAKQPLELYLTSDDELERYWGYIVASTFGRQAKALIPLAKAAAENDSSGLVRCRAAQFLAIADDYQPQTIIKEALAAASNGIEANLILNMAVMLRDGLGCEMQISEQDLTPESLETQDVRRRLAYFAAGDGKVDNPRGIKQNQKMKAKR